MLIESAQSVRVSILLILKFALARSATIKNIVDSSDDIPIPADRLKPDLGCILFSNAGCQITCNVMCDLYDCQSEARCVYEFYCDCQETYDISSAHTTVSDYNHLSFNTLWNYKFEKSKTSNNLRKRILDDSAAYDEIIGLLRNPHKTGIDVKKRLLEVHPKWKKIRQLKPKAHGHIYDLVTESEEFDNIGIKEYVDTDAGLLIDQMFDKLQKIKYKKRLAKVFDNTDEDEIEYIIEQILLARKDSLYDYASNYLQKKGLQIDDLVQSVGKRDHQGSITINDIDQLILASVMQKLLEVKEQTQLLDGNGGFALSAEMETDNDDLYDSDFSDEITNQLKKRKRIIKSQKTSDELKLETYSFGDENDRSGESYDSNEIIGYEENKNGNKINDSNQQIIVQSSNSYVGESTGTANGQYYDSYAPPMGYPSGYYPPPPPPPEAYSYNYAPPPPPPEAYAYIYPPPPGAYLYDYPPAPAIPCDTCNENQADSNRWWSFWGSVGSDETTDYKQSVDSNQGWSFWGSGSDETNYQNNNGWWSESESCCDGYTNGGNTQNWDLGNSGNGNSVQSWDLGKSGVTIGSGAAGNTGMQWKLGKSSITLADDGRGNMMQSWDLGNSGVHLQQSSTPECWTCD